MALPYPTRRWLARAVALALLLPGCVDDAPPELGWRQLSLWSAARPSARRSHATANARAIRALAQEPGATLVFPIDVAQDAYLSFRPIVESGACTFTVAGVDDSGSRARAYTGEHRPSGPALPREVTVDLAAWTGRTARLELSLRAAGAEPCRALWGSPRVVDRAPPTSRPLISGVPDIILLTADTLRADALGAYGREASVTPALDALAAQSDVFTDAFASANNTNPSFASLMTGLYVQSHGVADMLTPLPDGHSTLAERLGAAGFETRAVVSVAHLRFAALDQGFDVFVRPAGQFYAETVVDLGIEWLQAAGDDPLFVWLHFFDPHAPHRAPAPFDEGRVPAHASGMAAIDDWVAAPAAEWSGPLASYAGEVAYLDQQIGRLLDFVDSQPRSHAAIVAFVADHGEALGERGVWLRHTGLFDETTRVPLMIRWPARRSGRRVAGLVQHFDLFPTLLAALGLEPGPHDGRPLPDSSDATRDAVFANHANELGEMVRTRDHLYFRNRGAKAYAQGAHFFDLRSDPRAEQNLAGAGLAAEAELAARLDAWQGERRAAGPARRIEISDTEREQLRALGYGD